MSVLSLIQEAIDVRFMDIKNISNLIYDYIEYEEFEGPGYDVYLDLGDRVRIYIHEDNFLAVEKVVVRFSAEDGGIILNGEDYLKLGDGYEYFKEWASTYDRNEFMLVRIMDKFHTRSQAKSMNGYNVIKKEGFLKLFLLELTNMRKFHLNSLKSKV